MTKRRDLTWDNLDRQYRAGVAHQLARYALSVDYADLPENVVKQAKRCVMDGLACAIGGYDAPGRPICETTAAALGGPPEATVIGSGRKLGAVNATLVNCFMLRFLEYNDVGGGNHNTEAIPALLAVAERDGRSGRDFLAALVVSYEIGVRVIASLPGAAAGWDRHGWSTDARGGLNMPPAIGKLTGLSEVQIAHAIAICASRGIPLGILDADREENAMVKNLRFGMITRDAIEACLLASHGLTGPLRVVEGDGGYNKGLVGGEMDFDKLVDFTGWRILDTRHKKLCANGSTQGHLNATIGIVLEHDLKPEDIEKVVIRAGAREARHTTSLAKKYPRNAETADHSAFYATAYAIKERHFGPDSAHPRHFADPVILDLIERISVVHDSSLPDRGREGISVITTRDGRTFERHGDALKEEVPDSFLEDKLRDLSAGKIPDSKVEEIIERIWSLDEEKNIQFFMSEFAFENS